MPATKDELLKQLLVTFQVEAAEHLETLNHSLLQIEREANEQTRHELVQTAFRSAHSLKGAARAVGLNEIESVAHELESVLQRATTNTHILDPNTCDVLYTAFDTIAALLEGQAVGVAPLMARLSVLNDHETPVQSTPVAKEETEQDTAGSDNFAEENIRVSVGKLDQLMAEAGELLVAKISAEHRLNELQTLLEMVEYWPKLWREIRIALANVSGEGAARLTELLERHSGDVQALSQGLNGFHFSSGRDVNRLSVLADRLQEEIRRLRMVPFETIALSLQRVVRDAAQSEGKLAVLSITGSAIELDKRILEVLKDPLLHLLRNAVSHGIELPDGREAAGKPTEGHIRVDVTQRGAEILIVVSDDGRGFDMEGLRRAAQQSGIAPGVTSTQDMIALAFKPGVSTAGQVTEISGRGIGLDVVSKEIEALQGRIVVNSTPNTGTIIQLLVPASLALTRGLIVRVNQERYAIPLLSVEKIIELRDCFTVDGRSMCRVDGVPLPVAVLADVLQRALGGTKDEKQYGVVLGIAEQRLVLVVDDVITELELAAKPLPRPLSNIRNVAGAAMMGNGEPVLILNTGDLVKFGQQVISQSLLEHQSVEPSKRHAHILVVDDSITTRTLEKNILEAAGYIVTTATDGLEAIKRLKEHQIHLVVSDVQMPQMDGIGLTQHLRDSGDYHELPIILVTSLESREDRERGMIAGANAYIVKRGFNQAELLTTIEQLL